MNPQLEQVYTYIDAHRDAFVEDLRKFLRQPSVSAENLGLEECADVLAGLMRDAGFDVAVMPVAGAGPVVFGEVRPPGAGRTLVCYGHYDVQPPDPLDQWQSGPWEAVVRDGRVYGRGATDDKGSLFETVKAVQAWLQGGGTLPVHLIAVFEGEEEIGSTHFGGWVATHHDLFQRAAGVYGLDANCDRFTGFPRMFLWGSEEILYVELRAKTARMDIWSGEAGLVPNAAWRLIWALNTLKDEYEKILIDRWYEDYVPLTDEDLTEYARLPFDARKVAEFFGLPELLGAKSGAEAYRAWYYEPTCTVAGFHSGYGGPGSKTIVPSEARAKVDFRLRPNQMPEKQFHLLQEHLRRHGFADIEVIPLPADARPTPLRQVTAPATWTGADIVRAMSAAARCFFGVEPIRIGGRKDPAPQRSLVEAHGLGVLPQLGNAALAALGIPDARGWMGDHHSNVHAPNEFISIDAFVRGVKIAATIMAEFARL